jgi:predicted aspartyl protease
MKFSYQRYVVTPSAAVRTGVLYRPEVPLRVIGPDGEAYLYALLDTGADTTLLPLSVAEAVGATIDDEAMQVTGVGGEQFSVDVGKMQFELIQGEEQMRWTAAVGLMSLEDGDDDIAVLGHAGFFENFLATFDGKQREVELHALGV